MVIISTCVHFEWFLPTISTNHMFKLHIRWRPVIWGFALQFVMAILVLHTHAGYVAFDYIGKKIAEFIAFAADGTKFVFGTEIIGNFGFGVLPIIIYFSMMTSMLYYVGFLPYIIKKVSWLFTVTCGTTGPESMATAGNMFLGMTESPLIVRPHIDNLTNSEICTGTVFTRIRTFVPKFVPLNDFSVRQYSSS